MRTKITQTMQRTRRWKFEAGTTEFILGGIFFWAGVALLLPVLLHRQPLFMLDVFVPGLFFTGILVEFIQRHHITPRLGYVEYSENMRKGLWRLGLLIVFSLVVFAGMRMLALRFSPETASAWIAPMLALTVSIVLIPYALQLKLRRLLWLGLVSAGIGLLLSPLALRYETTDAVFSLQRLGFYFLAMGLVFYISGGCTFWNFLRSTSLPAEATDGQ